LNVRLSELARCCRLANEHFKSFDASTFEIEFIEHDNCSRRSARKQSNTTTVCRWSAVANLFSDGGFVFGDVVTSWLRGPVPEASMLFVGERCRPYELTTRSLMAARRSSSVVMLPDPSTSPAASSSIVVCKINEFRCKLFELFIVISISILENCLEELL